MRSVLSSAVAVVDMLRAGAYGPLPAQAAEGLALAGDTLIRLGKLTDESIELERLESGVESHRPVRIDLKELTAAVVADFPAEGRALELRFHATGLWVIADAAGLRRAMEILLSNAARYSASGNPVEIHCELLHGDTVRWSVADRGAGIPEWFKPRIFCRFERAAESAVGGASPGSGLGLCIARAAVRRDRGQIGFRERPGGGTIFHVDLPASCG